FSTVFYAVAQEPAALHWQNPVREGLNGYGMKDIYLLPQADDFYLVGTEYPDPYRSINGVTLYQSRDLNEWKAGKLIFDNRKLSKKGWVYDILNAPEIHPVNGKFYLTFKGGNARMHIAQHEG
ncbi:MAG: family 43 glycosylhydrolase, partial [Spirosomaceae bacterium]|nr:family 43 glycosylhydrolase [Spirosomataceae bacterium]